jgi:hypothetical protein
MNLWLAIGTVAFFGAVQFWLAVPAGFAFGLHPAVVCLSTIGGGITGMLVVLIPGERIGEWLAKRRKGRSRSKNTERAARIWERYGLVGFAFFSPVVPGVPLGALMALALGAPKPRVLGWFTLSLAVWSVGVTLAGALFLDSFQ